MADPSAVVLIEMVYAEPQRAIVKPLSLPQGARVADALELAAADADFSRIDLGNAGLGIHGQVVQRDQLLRDGDRVEIYRPLAQDPKAARRKRAGRPGA
jgi:putative ubiquitin-RnfH superfamily antitoxin RatB of RatAB toxin-antitoxin module